MSEYIFTTSWDEDIPVQITPRRGARNITMRPKIRPVREICISKSWLTRDAVAINFMESKRKWLEKIFAGAPAKTQIADGDSIEFLGRRVLLLHDATRRGNEFIDNGNGTATLYIGGGADMLERRVRDFIRSEFLTAVREIIRTAPREFWPARITVRDTTTRWGSCSSTGTMSFSWRLAFAPTEIMRYVIMHELAHTKHMDHSPAFWATVTALYGDGAGRAKRWLKLHGGELHKYF